MKVLFLGDIVGHPGRQAVRALLPRWRAEQAVDLVVANGENAAGGTGLTPPVAEELFAAGVDVLTGGNHTWSKKEVDVLLTSNPPRVLRPLNYPPGTPGSGVGVFATPAGENVAVINLLGRTFMQPLDSPFRALDQALLQLAGQVRVILVDFHAEATSEKVALGWYADGRVSACIGTHTHVPTADERILPQGTAYLTDAGMVGPIHSVLGVKTEIILAGFLRQLPVRHEVERRGPVEVNGVWLDIDEASGRARAISRLREIWTAPATSPAETAG
ncbi:MAG: TIGR00282 family metallophosphoesterase [Limnochordaceae bacterium]|nr:TIGR00282 family metallophosphoesterase [Limnochordaceae bacterium]